MSQLMVDFISAQKPKIYRYHSLSCVCSYCLALDYAIVQEWSAEIGYLRPPRKNRWIRTES